MVLIYALIFILGEAITEGLLKRFNKAEWLFGGFIQWLTAIFLFALWFVVAYNFDRLLCRDMEVNNRICLCEVWDIRCSL